MMRLGFSGLSGRNGIQELQSLDAFLNRGRDSCPRCCRAAVFCLAGACGYNLGVPGTEIDGVLTEVLLGMYRGVMGGHGTISEDWHL